MERNLTERRALVTGSARGAGRATAERLAAAGAEVIGVDILDQELGPMANTFQADLGDASACLDLVASIGAVDIVANVHGLLQPRSIEETSVEDFDKAVDVNLRSVFLICQGTVPSMAARGWGRVINFSSVVARSGGETSTAYAAAKAGVIALSKSFASRFADKGVTVNSVAPAAIDTPLNAFLDDAGRDRIVDMIPAGRFSTPEEFAAVVHFLSGHDAGYITGATIDVNGGWVMT